MNFERTVATGAFSQSQPALPAFYTPTMGKSPDLHGSAPDKSPVSLVLIDVINDMEFPGGDELFPHALKASGNIAKLKQRCREYGIPTIYANDNFGRWQSDFSKLLQHCCNAGVRGQPIASLLRPAADDYFVLKPKHSAFFSTSLNTLLDHLHSRTIILAGFTADMCVLFSAIDAYMRDFKLIVPRDCVASQQAQFNDAAIEEMGRVLKADTRISDQLNLDDLVHRADAETQRTDKRNRR
jgi:nicotinamidase-related amidase